MIHEVDYNGQWSNTSLANMLLLATIVPVVAAMFYWNILLPPIHSTGVPGTCTVLYIAYSSGFSTVLYIVFCWQRE